MDEELYEELFGSPEERHFRDLSDELSLSGGLLRDKKPGGIELFHKAVLKALRDDAYPASDIDKNDLILLLEQLSPRASSDREQKADIIRHIEFSQVCINFEETDPKKMHQGSSFHQSAIQWHAHLLERDPADLNRIERLMRARSAEACYEYLKDFKKKTRTRMSSKTNEENQND